MKSINLLKGQFQIMKYNTLLIISLPEETDILLTLDMWKLCFTS